MYTPVSSRAASAYRQVGVQSGVNSASPHMLIKMLFDGLIQSLNAARGALQRGDIAEKGRQIGKAVRILEEGLKGGLNPAQGGEIAGNLPRCTTTVLAALPWPICATTLRWWKRW